MNEPTAEQHEKPGQEPEPAAQTEKSAETRTPYEVVILERPDWISRITVRRP